MAKHFLQVLAGYEVHRGLLEVLRKQVHNPSIEDLNAQGWLATLEYWNAEVPAQAKAAAQALSEWGAAERARGAT